MLWRWVWLQTVGEWISTLEQEVHHVHSVLPSLRFFLGMGSMHALLPRLAQGRPSVSGLVDLKRR